MRYPVVLAYHDVSPYPRLSGNWVPPCSFRNHVRFLTGKFNRIDPLNLPFPLPEDGFLITFDDALEGVHRYAYPVMEDAGVKGIVFVVTGFIGRKNLWDAHFGITVRHMSRSAISELSKAGWLIGSHTVSHTALPRLSEDQLRYELEYSKKYLEDLTGKEVSAIAYPFNMYDLRTLNMAREVGYKWGFAGPSLKGGFTSLNVPRIPVFLPDITLRHKVLNFWTAVDILTTLPARLTPLYMGLRERILNAFQRRWCI